MGEGRESPHRLIPIPRWACYPGFDWGDAGIGAAIALALAAMLIAGWRTLNRRPDQPAGV